MKTKHIFIALGAAVLGTGIVFASLVSVPPKPCPGYDYSAQPSLDQQRDAMAKYLSQYDDFANLRLSSKGMWILSWHGQLPANSKRMIETILAPRPVVTREVLFNKAALDTAAGGIDLELARLQKQGLIKGSIATLQLDGQSYKVIVNVPDASTEAEVIAQLKNSTNVPVHVEVTDSVLVVGISAPTQILTGCPIAL